MVPIPKDEVMASLELHVVRTLSWLTTYKPYVYAIAADVGAEVGLRHMVSNYHAIPINSF